MPRTSYGCRDDPAGDEVELVEPSSMEDTISSWSAIRDRISKTNEKAEAEPRSHLIHLVRVDLYGVRSS